MKKDMKKLLEKDIKTLQAELLKLKAELQDLRFKAAGAGLRDDKAIRTLKKNIARVLTAINAKK